MSHDPEAVRIAAKALDAAADEWQPNLGPWMSVGAEYVLDALAAAGYTVTRDRYEPATYAGTDEPMTDGRVPLYRKIEGSTDGADRD